MPKYPTSPTRIAPVTSRPSRVVSSRPWPIDRVVNCLLDSTESFRLEGLRPFENIEADALIASLYVSIAEDARERGSVFQNPVVANVMHGLWFRDTQDTGVRLTHLYFVDGVPIETMALIFTAVRNCIDEFQRGSHKKIDFSERAYKSVYESLLGQLKRWSEYSRARSDRAGDFRREVLANCRVAAGVMAQESSAEEVIGGIPESELFACEDGD